MVRVIRRPKEHQVRFWLRTAIWEFHLGERTCPYWIGRAWMGTVQYQGRQRSPKWKLVETRGNFEEAATSPLFVAARSNEAKKKQSAIEAQKLQRAADAGLWTRVYKHHRCRGKHCKQDPWLQGFHALWPGLTKVGRRGDPAQTARAPDAL
ncbi:hypothetical protein B0T16DRAFT_499354 [Cercophora newfieldiana]|uniref:Uncharacterized protein n=1 Tax=Cercophora newfieldiana TaxID=92897 RepID=A0AA39YQF9_9PEZI|nr:hypothetical protein B0T16DRAFT_499354 [Cercophora newfieldiana]